MCATRAEAAAPPPQADGPVDETVDWPARARTLAPLVAAAADEIERTRRLPPDLLDALHEAAMFRMMLPRSLGGGEANLATFVRTIETIAMADASTAWCLCQASGCSMVAAYLDPQAARHIFGPRSAVLAWGPASPGARAVAVPGGFRVTGRWNFASGSRHATWLGAHAPLFEADGSPRLGPDGRQLQRTMLLPADQARMHDVWNVVGLRGTASDSFSLDDLFVPEAHAVLRDAVDERREAGLAFCFTTLSLYASGFAGVALGIARAMLDALVALARDKSPRGRGVLREDVTVQTQVALCDVRLNAARCWLLASLDEIRADVAETRQPTVDQRMRIRLAATFAIQEARDVADAVWNMAGATAIFSGSAFDRRFRDIHTVTQQIQGRAAHFETAGRHLLGLEPDLTFV